MSNGAEGRSRHGRSRHRAIVGRRSFLGGAGMAGAAGLAATSPLWPGDPASAASSDGAAETTRATKAYLADIEPTHAPFTTSSPELDDLANVFWTVYGVTESEHSSSSRFGGPTWVEWAAMRFAWTAYKGYRAEAMSTLLSMRLNGSNGVTGKQPDGYFWSWDDCETWPDDNDYHEGVGSYHFDQIPRLVNATYLYYVWTRDEEFIDKALPRARLVMERYVLPVLGVDKGLLTIPDETNDGVANHSRPSTYFDQHRSGHQEAWINAATYTALQDMAKLERMAGTAKKAETYERLAKRFPAHFDKALWNDRTGRYGGWRDARGRLHDDGYVHVNLEAIGRGLGNAGKAHRVFAYLASPAEPIRYGPHKGSTDVYHNVVAARSTTTSTPQEDWDGWSDPSLGRKPYGDIVTDGGSLMWLNYYDVMARLRHQDADRAYARLRAMLERVGADSFFLTFASPHRLYDDFGESLVQVGTNLPFPESGIAILPLLEGFVGARATPEGLEVAPNLPSALLSAKVADLDYAGRTLSVRATRATAVAASDSGDPPSDMPPGAVAAREFEAAKPFDQAQIRVSATHGGWLTIALERRAGDTWTRVAARRHEHVEPTPSWFDLAFPAQEPGMYRVLAQRPGIDGPLPHPEGQGDGGMRLWAYRVVDAPQRPASPATASAATVVTRSSVDRFTLDLGRNVEGAVTVTLDRQVEGGWTTVATQILVIDGSRTAVLGTADQPPGRYRVSARRGDEPLADVTVRRLETATYVVESTELDRRATVGAGETYLLVPASSNTRPRSGERSREE
ncbi:MAG TPA: twin-arginine translocation signal domain-containing protein, partial [Actinopolymorphaceae bacterium]